MFLDDNYWHLMILVLITLIISVSSDGIDNCQRSNVFFSGCAVCQDGYYLSKNYQSCPECSESCLTCYNQDTCSSCPSNRTLFMNQCYDCNIQGCSLCGSDNTCVDCSDGYYLSQATCLSCPENCEQCDTSGVCEECENDYTLESSGECISESSQNQSNNSGGRNQNNSTNQSKARTIRNLRIAIALIVIGSFVFIVIVCVIKCLRRRYKKAEELRLEKPPVEMRNSGQIPEDIVIGVGVVTSSVFLKESKASHNELQRQSGSKRTEPNRDICAICLSDGTQIRTSCTHQFHTECLITWCRRKRICPDCNNTSFTLRMMCINCKQFNQPVKMCPSYCKQQNHYTCFQKKNRKRELCFKCRG